MTPPVLGPPDAPLTRGPPADWMPKAPGAAEVIRHITDDHDRIAQDMNDAAIHRIFVAGLDLHAALGLVGDHQATSNICHAIDELDQAIKDIRDTIFGLRLRDPRSVPRPGELRPGELGKAAS